MDRWRVNLLGRFELRAPDGREIALGARKSIALLALLAAAPGQRLSRDRLAVLLWEDMPDAQARGNLRQLLAATRRPAPFLEADAGSIGFSAGMVATDLGDFEKAGLKAAGVHPEAGLVEIVELKDHPWFIGVQFHPEYKSTVDNPHPLFKDFIKATLQYKPAQEAVKKEKV